MTKLSTSETLHDGDWSGKKADESFFHNSPRYPFLARLVVGLKPTRLFDLGCGSGYLVSLVRKEVPDLMAHGSDISRVALDRAARQLSQVWQVDIDHADLPVSASDYDVVTCVEVLEHIYDVAHALAEIHRILKPGGTAVLTVPNLAYWRYRIDLMLGSVPGPAADQRHLHQFDRRILEEAVRLAGLAPIRTEGFRLRMGSLVRWRPELFSDILVTIARKGAS